MSNNPKKYTPTDLSEAIKAVGTGMGIKTASRVYGIPRTTLRDRLNDVNPTHSRKTGPLQYVTEAEEKKIVDWCIQLVQCGFPRKEVDILNAVQKVILYENRKTPFANGRPGKKWYKAFLKRNPILTERTPEGLSKGRATITQEFIRSWFKELQDYLISKNCLDILDDPTRIYNGDETGFSMCPKTGKVLAPVGCKNVYTVNMSNEKESLTVLMVFSASGLTIPPMVVFPYKRTPNSVIRSIPADWYLGKSDSGWMRSETFLEYIQNGVQKWLVAEKIKTPVLLFVDGHKSHLSMELSEFCSNNGIILYALPANTTHIMQPADVSVFKPLKGEWRKTVRDWTSLPENINQTVTKNTFCPLFKMTLDNIDLKTTIKNGFRACGLYPFNPDAIDYSKCIQNVRENLNQAGNTPGEADIKTTVTVLNFFKNKLEINGYDVEKLIKIVSGTNTDVAEANIEPSTEIAAGTTFFSPTTNLHSESIFQIDANDEIIVNPLNITTGSLPPLSDSILNIIETRSPQTSKQSPSYSSPSLSQILRIPKPISKRSNKSSTPTRPPSAISSSAFRKLIIDKENEKQQKKDEVEKRKEERKRKKITKLATKSSKKLKLQKRIKCRKCQEDLISDVEDDGEKNIGCDKCANWFHLKCSNLCHLDYADASLANFICNFCK